MYWIRFVIIFIKIRSRIVDKLVAIVCFSYGIIWIEICWVLRPIEHIELLNSCDIELILFQPCKIEGFLNLPRENISRIEVNVLLIEFFIAYLLALFTPIFRRIFERFKIQTIFFFTESPVACKTLYWQAGIVASRSFLHSRNQEFSKNLESLIYARCFLA